jgi:hypothetical protein
MPTYEVILSRSYLVTVKARNAEAAGQFAAGYIDECDNSPIEGRKRLRFEIKEIELVDNDIIDVVVVNQ